MQIDLPECCSYAPDEEKGPYIYFVKGDKRVVLPGVYPLDQSVGVKVGIYQGLIKISNKHLDAH